VVAPAGWDAPRRRYGFLALVAAIVFSLDQLTKALIMRSMQVGDVIPLLPPVLDLHYITNRGVAFGLLSRLGDVFVPVAVVIMSVIFWYYRSLRSPRLWLRTALGLQLGGALGNLLDRLRYGSVVDFVEFHVDPIGFRFAVFNVADSAIVIGVCILLATLLLRPD
jgi:signal peptidase II